MMRPQYANAFSVAYNQKLGEVIINFSQEYPVKKEISDLSEGGVQIKTDAARDDVCGIVLPKETANQLIDIIRKSITSAVEDS